MYDYIVYTYMHSNLINQYSYHNIFEKHYFLKINQYLLNIFHLSNMLEILIHKFRFILLFNYLILLHLNYNNYMMLL